MGLISWIKEKYYNNRLEKADKLVLKQDFQKAENIYRKLFDKQPLAVAHLANRYVIYSHDVEEKLRALRAIDELREFTDSENVELYEIELNNHISNISNLAAQRFSNRQYHEAVLLIDSISVYKSSDKSYLERVQQYHAYLSFDKMLNALKYDEYLSSLIHELKSYQTYRAHDIKNFVDCLISKSYYYRAIKLLTELQELDSSFRDQIVDYAIKVIDKHDSDLKSPKKISLICADNRNANSVAAHLFSLSNEAEKREEYATSVYYDTFAAEFLSEDNTFNVARCKHKFYELAPRSEAKEISDLLTLANKLNLSDLQITDLKNDILGLAKKTEPIKGINICRLFIGEKPFDQIYISQAEKLTKNSNSQIDTNELLSVIRANSNEDSFSDIITPFVRTNSEYVSLFLDSAINKIRRHKSVDFLKKYWGVQESTLFFERLIISTKDFSSTVVDYIISNRTVFLNTSKYTNMFLNVVSKLNDKSYTYTITERLYDKRDVDEQHFEVLNHFIKATYSRCEELSAEESVSLINHTLSVIDFLKIYPSTWIPLYLKKRDIQKADVSGVSQLTSFYKESVETIIGSSVDFSTLSEPSYFSLWEDYTAIAIKRASSQPKEKAIDDLVKMRGKLVNYCKSYVTYTSLLDALTNKVVKLRWALAKELEEDSDIPNAISQYKSIIEDNSSSFSTKAEFRYLICHIKGSIIYDALDEDIKYALEKKSYQQLKDDLAYRYACYLIKATRPSDAEFIITSYLPEETELLDICKNLHIIEAENYLARFNEVFKQVEDNTLSLQDALDFYKQFPMYKYTISKSLSDTTNKFVSYRRKLEAYIVKSFFNEEKYATAFEKLQLLYPNFFEDETNFRNVAIAALGTVESQDEVSNDTFYNAISVWLSAIYSDELFVKSLEYTSWDDPFSFTLEGSLGQTVWGDYDNLPENVNFDEPVENENIAISTLQNSLISRMETYIRDNKPEFEEFFNNEKEALDALVELNLDEKCILAAPYFAKGKKRIIESIKDSFDTELTHEYGNYEDVLSLGVKYGFNDKEYAQYNDAIACAEKCKTAISSTAAKLKAELSSLARIKKFDKLHASVKSFFSDKMNEAIKEKMPYKKFIDTFEIICKAFNDNPLSLAFSQYANGEVVHRVIDKTMKPRVSVGYMVRIYNVAPSSIQVKKNLEYMLCKLASSCAKSPNAADEQVLAKALRDTGNTFKAKVEDARIQGALSAIVDKVNGNRMTEQKALDEVYELYKKCPDDDQLCENLVTLCDICIEHYILGQPSGSYSVKKTLNALNNNKSTTFNRYASKLAAKYSKIWGQLPHGTKRALQGSSFNTTLNSKGEALKEALDYYKKLGNYTSSRSGSSILDILNDYPF